MQHLKYYEAIIRSNKRSNLCNVYFSPAKRVCKSGPAAPVFVCVYMDVNTLYATYNHSLPPIHSYYCHLTVAPDWAQRHPEKCTGMAGSCWDQTEDMQYCQEFGNTVGEVVSCVT